MTPIPQKIRKQISADPFYKTCSLYGQHGHVCGGRITMEHAFIFGGKQVQALWAIIPVCASGQEVDNFQDAGTMSKEQNRWVAISRASIKDLQIMCGEEMLSDVTPLSKTAPYLKLKKQLTAQFGVYEHKVPGPIEKPNPIYFEIRYPTNSIQTGIDIIFTDEKAKKEIAFNFSEKRIDTGVMRSLCERAEQELRKKI